MALLVFRPWLMINHEQVNFRKLKPLQILLKHMHVYEIIQLGLKHLLSEWFNTSTNHHVLQTATRQHPIQDKEYYFHNHWLIYILEQDSKLHYNFGLSMISKLLNFSQMDISFMALGFDIYYYHIILVNSSSIKVVNSLINTDTMAFMSMLS